MYRVAPIARQVRNSAKPRWVIPRQGLEASARSGCPPTYRTSTARPGRAAWIARADRPGCRRPRPGDQHDQGRRRRSRHELRGVHQSENRSGQSAQVAAEDDSYDAQGPARRPAPGRPCRGWPPCESSAELVRAVDRPGPGRQIRVTSRRGQHAAHEREGEDEQVQRWRSSWVALVLGGTRSDPGSHRADLRRCRGGPRRVTHDRGGCHRRVSSPRRRATVSRTQLDW